MNIQPGSHIDHLIRQTRWHHAQLSSMADVKANMMLTISSVVLTLSIRYLTEPLFRPAAIILIIFCLITVLMAAYAAMPKTAILKKNGHSPDVKNPAFNLLFFGDFSNLSYDQFMTSMEESLATPEKSYEIQLREIYTLGCFLANKKYRFVRLAYLSFITGLFLSVLIFILTELLARG
ncbi:MAG: hypothetical protein KA314_24780 [Chloroflexi bacterium]|nr:hypothetical protein [Chloroflexota bacterium]MBP8059063.1 hypothetical protein [Chloroflexota bacterium]